MVRKFVPWLGLAIGLFATACGQKQAPHQAIFQVDSDFLPYVTAFENAAAEQGAAVRITDLIVSYGPTPNANETGVCEIATDESPRISINSTIWQYLSPMDRQQVMFHELGHCVLRRLHKNSQAVQGGSTIPSSMMYSVRIPGGTYSNNMAFYHIELFSSSNEF